MSDLALAELDGRWDLAAADGDLMLDDGLTGAIVIALLADARAPRTAVRAGENPRGWFSAPIGSLIWLYRRAKNLPQTADDVRLAAEEALAHLVPDRVAKIEVTAAREGREQIHMEIRVTQHGGGQRIIAI